MFGYLDNSRQNIPPWARLWYEEPSRILFLLTPLFHIWPHDTHTHLTMLSKQDLEKLCHIFSIHVETPDISPQELHSTHRHTLSLTHTLTHIYIEATGRADQNYQGGRGRGGESRACPKPLCRLQVENSMTLGFCYLSFCFSHEKVT